MKNKFYLLPLFALTILIGPVKAQVPQTPDSSLFSLWNTNDQVFVPYYFEIYEYDQDGRIIEMTRKNSAGVSQYRITRSYNQAGKRTTDEREYFDTLTASFKKDFKTEILYDNHNNPVSRRTYRAGFGGGGYQLESILDSTERVYDVQGRLKETYPILENSGGWERKMKTEFLYYGNDTVPHALYDYIKPDSVWLNTKRYEGLKWELGYDSYTIRQPTLATYYGLNNGIWVPEYYDSSVVTNGKKESQFFFRWDGASFVPEVRTRYTYDKLGSLSYFEYESFQSNAWQPTQYSRKDSAVYNQKDQALYVYEMLFYSSTGEWQFSRERKNFFTPPVSVAAFCSQRDTHCEPRGFLPLCGRHP